MLLSANNGGGFLLQVLKDVRDYRRVFNAGDHFDLTAAEFTDLNINIEHALEALHPGHGAMPFFRTLIKPILATRFSLCSKLATLGRCNLNAVFAVWCKNPVKSCQINPWLGH